MVGNRIDAGLTWFAPRRNAEIVGNAYGANGSYDGNDTANFFIPEFGYTKQLSATTAVGVAVYGNGGMNTDYGKNPFGAFGGSDRAGINLAQAFISPSVAYRLNERHAIGAALNFAYQRFSADGLGAFAPMSSDQNNLTDRGADTSSGWGVRLGWNGRITPDLAVGLTWASRINTSKFDHYRGLFAGGGNFDIPGNYGIGVAMKANACAHSGSGYSTNQIRQHQIRRQPAQRQPAGFCQRTRLRLARHRCRESRCKLRLQPGSDLTHRL